MSKLIPMEEAAKVLGLSVEKLNELRSNNEVFGYRDGSTWKFKMSELERVADDMGLSISPLSSAVDGIKGVLGLDDLDGDASDSSELDLGLEESSQDLFLEADSDSIAMDDSSVELFQSPVAGGDGGTSSDILSGDDDDDDDMIDLAESGLLVKSSSKDMVLDNADDDDELSLFDSSDDLNLDDALDEAADDLMMEDSLDDFKLEESSDDFKLEESSADLKLEDSSNELKLDDAAADDLMLEGSSDDLKLDDAADDLMLEGSSVDLNLEESSDDLKLEDSGLQLKTDGDDSVKLTDDSVLDGDDDLSFGSSSLELASEAKASGSPSSTGDDLFSEEPSSGAPSTGKLVGGSDDDDDLALNVEDDLFDDDLDLADSASFESSEVSSNFDESSDLVLDSDSSGELTLEANESGIALSANESGIALGDEPLELGGSDIDELELPEDDDIVLVDDVADADSATLMQEDDFNLTPHEMSLDDDDSSGSQVIALAESEIYADDSAATILGGESFDDHSFGGGDYDPTTAGMVGAGVVGAAGMAAAGTGGIAAEEVSYSKWQIGGLVLTASALFLGSIVAYGTAQNLWLPDDEVVSSGLMKLFIDSLGMN